MQHLANIKTMKSKFTNQLFDCSLVWLSNARKKSILTVRLPRFFTLQTKCTVFPTNPVILDGMVVSKYGPVPGVGYSCRKSVKNRLELPSEEPEKEHFFKMFSHSFL